MTLYSDGIVDNVFGLLLVSPTVGNPSGLQFLPHADGSPAQPLRVYSDFQVMEDFICCNIGKVRPTFNCGNCDPGTANVFN